MRATIPILFFLIGSFILWLASSKEVYADKNIKVNTCDSCQFPELQYIVGVNILLAKKLDEREVEAIPGVDRCLMLCAQKENEKYSFVVKIETGVVRDSVFTRVSGFIETLI